MTIEESMDATKLELPLQRIRHWEKVRAHHVYLTQPMGGGIVRDYTWAQAVGEARRIAAWLKSEGRQRGWPEHANIALISKNCAHWIMCDLAIWMAGYVSVPLYPTLAAQTVRQILEHSEAGALFVGKLDDWSTMKTGVPENLLCLTCALSPPLGLPNESRTWEEIVEQTAPLAQIPARGADELATIIYTSGTTGTPKGVMHSFGNFARALEVASQVWKLDAGDRVLSHLPLSHIAERFAIETSSIYHGLRVYFVESLETFARDLQRARPTMFVTVPRLWAKFQQGVFAKIPKPKLDRLLKLPLLSRIVKKKVLTAMGLDHARIAVGGAAPMPPAMLEWYRSLGLELLEAYGMTENFGLSHCTRPGGGRAGYVGLPHAGVECRLAENGEVIVRARTNMLGYYKAPELTREVLSEDGWLATGDLGELDEQGRLRITGRAKELFKTSKGKYVAPAPIENKLSAHPKIEACCVTGADFPQPFAIAMLSPEATAAAREPAQREQLGASLAEHLQSVNAELDPHEQLDFLAVVGEPWTVESGFITPTLKLKRNVLERYYEPRFAAWQSAKQPVVWAGE